MARHTESDERKNPTAQLTVPSKDLLQIWRRNQKLYRQAKAERIQHQQSSSSTNAKGSCVDRKHRKGVETWTQNNKLNGKGIILTNNYLKCKWIECPNQKTKTGWKDTKTRPLYILSTRDPPQNKRQTDWKLRLEKDISHKWRLKESKSSNSHIR